jgi:hypothetical protein
MVESSPQVLEALGMDPRTYPLSVCAGCLGLWAANLWLCVDELRTLQKERAQKPAPQPQTDEQQKQ